MQSLDSSCQEADFIINDTLKKLKGSSNSANTSAGTSATTLASNNPTTATILRQQQIAYPHLPNSSSSSTQQQQHKFQQFNQLQSALQGSNVSSTAVSIGGGSNNSSGSCLQNLSHQQQQQLSPPAPPTPPSLVSTPSFSVTFPPKSSLIDNSLLHCNISQIPSQPPLCIFEDDEEPSNPMDQPPVELLAPTNTLSTSGLSKSASQNRNSDSTINLDNIVILREPASTPNSTVQQNIQLSHPSPQQVQPTSYSNFNSITSPSPIVPDLLLSTPPGVHNSNSHNNNNNSSNHNNNNKKADKRPSSSTSSSQHHHQHNHLSHNSHLLTSPGAAGSPTSSPSKRQKN